MSAGPDLLPSILDPDDRPALSIGSTTISYQELATASSWLMARLAGVSRVAIWMTASPESVVALVASLLAGVPAVPLNPRAGEIELTHIVRSARPEMVFRPPGVDLPALANVPAQVVHMRSGRRGQLRPPSPGGESPALIVYTSGTTGTPKGVVISRRAIATNLDALAEAWRWTASDSVVHALPLFHIHGLVLGTLGPLRRGGRAQILEGWSEALIADAFEGGATMLFAVPTMYHRLVPALAARPGLAASLRRARLLVSGSAPLALSDAEQVLKLTGNPVVQRYGLTETLINCAERAGDQPGLTSVGPPLPGVEVRLLDEAGGDVAASGPEALGEVAVRGPNLLSGYLVAGAVTPAPLREGWFQTGDVAWRDDDGRVHLVGRKDRDIIKSGGFKIAAGEVEAALASHPALVEVAVCPEPDEDLGQRVAAWITLRPGASVAAAELTGHVARLLAPHKRPRRIYVVDHLPRNALGKVRKDILLSGDRGRVLG